MKAACIQMDISLCEKQENLEHARLMANEAISNGAEIIIYPEVFSTGFCYDNISGGAEKTPCSTLEVLSNYSKEHDCIIIGSIIEAGNGNRYMDNNQDFFTTITGASTTYYNLGFCIEYGELVGIHRKTHLYGLERKYFESGKRISPILLPISGLKVGLQICFELRFPEIARKLALEGSDILVTVAEMAEPKAYHWRSLSIARSIENQIPHIACNRLGSDQYSTYFGGSLITDAWGVVKAEAGTEECILISDIDFSETKKVRKLVPLLESRNPELY
jgi:predicted amidohydrolase